MRSACTALFATVALQSAHAYYVEVAKSVLQDDDHIWIEVKDIEEKADAFLLTKIDGELYFVAPGPSLSKTAVPIRMDVVDRAVIFDFPVTHLPPGRYLALVVLTRPGGDPGCVHDWLEPYEGVWPKLFHVKVDLFRDRDGDGWLDDDHDHDGWSDGDLIAGDPILGQRLYALYCTSCHGAEPDEAAKRGALDPGKIKAAIGQDVGGMGRLNWRLSDQDLADIAAWIASFKPKFSAELQASRRPRIAPFKPKFSVREAISESWRSVGIAPFKPKFSGEIQR